MITRGYKIFKYTNYAFMVFVILLTLTPFLNVVSMSFSSNSAIILGEVGIIPKGFNLGAYKRVLADPYFFTGYKNTIVYTCCSTLVSLFMTTICAYALSKKRLTGRKAIMSLIILTMIISGGLVPNFILIKSLGWINKIWAIIIPGAISHWNLFITIAFFQTLPNSLEEAAEIDGLNPIQIFAKIVLPLSKPILATITLYYAVSSWNNWFGPWVYMTTKDKYPVTLYLRSLIVGAELAAREGDVDAMQKAGFSPTTIRTATIVLVSFPILMVYPFIQKYFVKGVMIGSIKG